MGLKRLYEVAIYIDEEQDRKAPTRGATHISSTPTTREAYEKVWIWE